MNNLKIFLPLLCASLASFGCTIDDADLDSSGVASFEVVPDADTVAVFEVGVTASADLSFVSGDDATLDVWVNGALVYEESFDASSETKLDTSPTLPLSRVGPNDITATLSYEGNELTKTATVTVAPSAPTVAFPTWSTDFSQSGDVTVDIDPDWSIDEVAYSVDGGPFATAQPDGDTTYTLALQDLDIGDSDLLVRVDSSNRGHTQSHFFADTIKGIVPVFDCSSTTSMEPTSELIANNNFEVRTMRGYFGDPDGGHTVTFVITFTDDNGDTYVNPSRTLVYGRTSLDAEFNVRRLRCDGGCTDDYDLEAWVDGTLLCSQINYGVIREY